MAPELRRRLSALERRASPTPRGPGIDVRLLTDEELEYLEGLPRTRDGREIDPSQFNLEQCDRVEAIYSRFVAKAA